jgi:hypothetical protein
VQVLSLADEYEALISGERGTKMSPAQASQEVICRLSRRYHSLVLDGFARAFAQNAAGANA